MIFGTSSTSRPRTGPISHTPCSLIENWGWGRCKAALPSVLSAAGSSVRYRGTTLAAWRTSSLASVGERGLLERSLSFRGQPICG
jgi:hypothetical protein